MSNTDTTATFTAVRTWNRPRTKATVTVYNADGSILLAAGGNRAARAQAIIIVEASESMRTAKGPGLYGLRSDLFKAQTEAGNLAVARLVRSRRYGDYTSTPYAMAVAVPVAELVETSEVELGAKITTTPEAELAPETPQVAPSAPEAIGEALREVRAELAAIEAKAATLRAERDELIAKAAKAGMSHRLISIEAGMSHVMVGKILAK